MISDIKDSSDTPRYSFLCPLPWLVKTEDILTSDKLGKVEITLKDDKQMEDKPCRYVFAWSSLESEWTRKERVTLFMLASAITPHKEIVYITLLILTTPLVSKVCVYTQHMMLSGMVDVVYWLNKKSRCFNYIEAVNFED